MQYLFYKMGICKLGGSPLCGGVRLSTRHFFDNGQVLSLDAQGDGWFNILQGYTNYLNGKEALIYCIRNPQKHHDETF